MTFSQEFLAKRFSVLGADEMHAIVENAKGFNVTNPPKGIRSNTTIFAIMYDKGVVIAGDRRTSDGYYGIFSDVSNKVMKLTDFSAMANAGWCNVISFLENNMLAICDRFENIYGRPLSVDGQANYLKNLLTQWWFFFVQTWHWTPGIPILAAYDLKLEKPRIFTFDYDGYFVEPPFFAGNGCGIDFVKGLINDRWRKDMPEDEAINLAVRAMLHSGALSSGVSDARLVLPTVAVINQKGFNWVEKDVLTSNRDELVKQIGGIQCLLG